MIYMPSHASFLDPVLSLNIFATPASYVVKKELLKIPIIGQAFRHGRVIPIDRANLAEAIESLKIAQRYAKNGRSIVIAPEGTRRRKRSFEDKHNILEFKKGPFHLAKDAGLKIVPVVYVGANRLLSPDKFGVSAGNVYVRICEAIPYEKIKNLTFEQMVELVRNTMIENSQPRTDVEIFSNDIWRSVWILGFWVGFICLFKLLSNMKSCLF